MVSGECAPGLIIGALNSGAGKTTVATGLMRALSMRGTRVAPFKVGPDYIDPSYHTVACGRPGRNLDTVLCPRSLMGSLYAHGTRDADIAVVEGVMGLYDGRVATTPSVADTEPPIPQGSTADIAATMGLPVVLVVDAKGASHTVGVIVAGVAAYSAPLSVRIVGVILNRVGSPRHAKICTQAIESHGIPVLGAIPRREMMQVPSRHLGLVTAGELAEVRHAVDSMGACIADSVDVQRLADMASHPARGLQGVSLIESAGASIRQVLCDAQYTGVKSAKTLRVALAGGSAFSFVYPEEVEILNAAGVEVISFDPLRENMPENVHGLILPGGFPEEHVVELRARRDVLASIRTFIHRGGAVKAECAGLLILAETLDNHPMVGAIQGLHARMSPHLTLGYRDAVALCDSSLYSAGTRICGHEFHRTILIDAQGAPVTSGADIAGSSNPWSAAWGWRKHAPDLSILQEGFVRGRVHASYLHVHPVANVPGLARFVRACADYASDSAACL